MRAVLPNGSGTVIFEWAKAQLDKTREGEKRTNGGWLCTPLLLWKGVGRDRLINAHRGPPWLLCPHNYPLVPVNPLFIAPTSKHQTWGTRLSWCIRIEFVCHVPKVVDTMFELLGIYFRTACLAITPIRIWHPSTSNASQLDLVLEVDEVWVQCIWTQCMEAICDSSITKHSFLLDFDIWLCMNSRWEGCKDNYTQWI